MFDSDQIQLYLQHRHLIKLWEFGMPQRWFILFFAFYGSVYILRCLHCWWHLFHVLFPSFIAWWHNSHFRTHLSSDLRFFFSQSFFLLLFLWIGFYVVWRTICWHAFLSAISREEDFVLSLTATHCEWCHSTSIPWELICYTLVILTTRCGYGISREIHARRLLR